MSDRSQPMQPIERDDEGVIRFRENKIVRFLLDWASRRGMDLNELSVMPFPKEDWEQFAQLIGYSVSGFGDLSYASKEMVEKADAIADAMSEVVKS